MKTIEDAVAWLYGSQRQGIKFGLENTCRLLEELALPEPQQRFFHVAGTNGKGSTCAFLEVALRAAGHRTGLFTSPHLVKFNERIRVAGDDISDEDVHRGILRLEAHVAKHGWEHDPTFFELTFALALGHFRDAQAELIVLETGLGGRLDSTNAITPLVSVIAPIGLDHRKMLGDTLGAIAGEKAGILKPGIPAVSAPQKPEAEAVLRATADQVGASIEFVTEPWPAEDPLGIPGNHQRENAALAAAAIRAAGITIPENVIAEAYGSARWRARFETLEVGANRTLVVDGAHNDMAAASLAATWIERFGNQKAVIVMGTVADKDAGAVARELSPIADQWIVVETPSPRAMTTEILHQHLVEHAGDAPVEVIADPIAAIESALHRGQPVLVTGSLFLAGHVIAWAEGDRNAYQRSRQ